MDDPKVRTTVSYGKMRVQAPYNRTFIEEAKQLGGEWNGSSTVFDPAQEVSVRSLLLRVFGTSSGPAVKIIERRKWAQQRAERREMEWQDRSGSARRPHILARLLNPCSWERDRQSPEDELRSCGIIKAKMLHNRKVVLTMGPTSYSPTHPRGMVTLTVSHFVPEQEAPDAEGGGLQ